MAFSPFAPQRRFTFTTGVRFFSRREKIICVFFSLRLSTCDAQTGTVDDSRDLLFPSGHIVVTRHSPVTCDSVLGQSSLAQVKTTVRVSSVTVFGFLSLSLCFSLCPSVLSSVSHGFFLWFGQIHVFMCFACYNLFLLHILKFVSFMVFPFLCTCSTKRHIFSVFGSLHFVCFSVSMRFPLFRNLMSMVFFFVCIFHHFFIFLNICFACFHFALSVFLSFLFLDCFFKKILGSNGFYFSFRDDVSDSGHVF